MERQPSGTDPKQSQVTGESAESRVERREAFEKVLFHLRSEHAVRTQELEFHGLHHVDEVIAGVEAFFDALGIDQDDPERQAAILAAAGHDLVQRSQISPDGKRQRLGGFDAEDIPSHLEKASKTQTEKIGGTALGGGNEGLSAKLTIDLISSYDHKGLITADMKRLIEKAIRVTVPQFVGLEPVANEIETNNEQLLDSLKNVVRAEAKEKLPQVFLIEQKHLTNESSLAELAVAMSDLFQVGRVSPRDFFETGNQEFREMYVGFDEKLYTPLSELSTEEKTGMASEMLFWWQNQISFALGQKQRFERLMRENRTLAQLDDIQRQIIFELFGNFDDNIKAMDAECGELQDKYHSLEDKSFYKNKPQADELFQQLAQEMGYIQVMRS